MHVGILYSALPAASVSLDHPADQTRDLCGGRGTPTLELGAQNNSAGRWADRFNDVSGYMFQLGQTPQGGGGYAGVYIENTVQDAWVSPFDANGFLPLDIVGSLAESTVPEPAMLSLLGLGLAGVGFMRRRQAA